MNLRDEKLASRQAGFDDMGAIECGLVGRVERRMQFDQVEANHVGFGAQPAALADTLDGIAARLR